MRIMRNRSIWKCPYYEKFPRNTSKDVMSRGKTFCAEHYASSNLMIALRCKTYILDGEETIITSDESWLTFGWYQAAWLDLKHIVVTRRRKMKRTRRQCESSIKFETFFSRNTIWGPNQLKRRKRMCHMSREMRNLQQTPAATIKRQWFICAQHSSNRHEMREPNTRDKMNVFN